MEFLNQHVDHSNSILDTFDDFAVASCSNSSASKVQKHPRFKKSNPPLEQIRSNVNMIDNNLQQVIEIDSSDSDSNSDVDSSQNNFYNDNLTLQAQILQEDFEDLSRESQNEILYKILSIIKKFKSHGK